MMRSQLKEREERDRDHVLLDAALHFALLPVQLHQRHLQEFFLLPELLVEVARLDLRRETNK